MEDKIENRTCGGCGYYPFCVRTEGASFCCDKWIKRQRKDMKLESKDRYIYNFKEIEWRKKQKKQ